MTTRGPWARAHADAPADPGRLIEYRIVGGRLGGMTEAPPETRARWAEARLRSALVTGEIPPGTPIRVERLAEEWQISATPLREALRALDNEGLVVSTANRGSRASPISMEHSREVYELRLVLEPRAMRLSVMNGDDQWRASAFRAWEELKAVWQGPDVARVEPTHTAFHQALMSACGSESLLEVTRRLSVQSIRLRLLSAAGRGGMERAHEEHIRLYETCVAGDVDLATELCAAHIGLTVKTMLGPEALRDIAGRLRAAVSTDDGIPTVLERLADE